MTKKSCIKAVIDGMTPDVTPYYIDLTFSGQHKVAEYYEIDVDSVQKHLGNYMLYLKFTEPENFVPEQLGAGKFKDEFGVLWDSEKGKSIGDWSFVNHPVIDMNLKGYQFPAGKGSGRFVQAEKTVHENPDCFNLLQMTGVFDTAWHVTGIQDLLMGMALDGSFISEMLDKSLEYNLNIIDQLPEFIDGVRFIEDWGDQRCLMMGPANWRKHLKPRLKLMYDACHKKGCAVFIHSCGNITELFPDLIGLGVDVVDPIQPEVMNVEFIKKEYGKEIVLFGGLGCQSTMPLGTPEMVVGESRERIASLSKNGGYIFGPAGAIPTETPIGNIVALIDFCKAMRPANDC